MCILFEFKVTNLERIAFLKNPNSFIKNVEFVKMHPVESGVAPTIKLKLWLNNIQKFK